MRRHSILQSISIFLSSMVSIFSGHALHAAPFKIKDASKKTLRPMSLLGGEKDPSSEEVLAFSEGKDRYPWRIGIVTTTFWIGEKPTENNPVPNHKSAWDTKWAENYGGTDAPERSKRTPEFTPKGFIPGQNPFYVALPYNDMTSHGHKPEARNVIPWFGDAYRDERTSVCKGRWIAVRFQGRVCYAQWEDSGPFRTDHWQYVFGTERPRPNLNHGAGLDVSPAVRDYLGMGDTDVTDWKFIEFHEVPSGPWARYGDNNTFVINRRAAAEAHVAAETFEAVRDGEDRR